MNKEPYFSILSSIILWLLTLSKIGIPDTEGLTDQRRVNNSPGFYHFCLRQFMCKYLLFLPHSLFSFFMYFLALQAALGASSNRKRKQKRENAAEKDIIT